MARQPVAELWIATQGALVHVGSTAPVHQSRSSSNDLRAWVEASAIPWQFLLFGGMGLAGLAMLLWATLPLGLLEVTAIGSMFSLGGGSMVLGLLKRGAPTHPAVAALPQASDPQVLAERMRRVRAAIGDGSATFEVLLQRLRWTESALLETLVRMKEAGVLEEDLDLDSGEWIYRAVDGTAMGGSLSPTLADRQLRAGGEHR